MKRKFIMKKGILIFFVTLVFLSLPLWGKGRLIEHTMGKTSVPMNPKRIVVLDGGAVDATVILGFIPTGAVNVFSSGIIPVYLNPYVKGKITTQSVGTLAEPNLEKILLLKPDLILSTIGRSKNIYPQLSKIAPTVIAGIDGGYYWRENFKLYAQALGKEKESHALLSQYDKRVQSLKIALSQKKQLPSLSIIRFFMAETRLYPAKTFIGSIITDLGLPRPDDQASLTGKKVVGPESIPDMDADFLFYSFLSDPMGAGKNSKESYPAFFESPLWKKLKAYQKEQIFEVPDEYWMSGTGLGAALLVLSDLEHILLGKR